MVNRELELLLFPIKQDTGTLPPKKQSKKLMEKVFENAKSITIPKKINIDELMNDMNDALS
jgi:U3 small nucleolar ribonucleoprotein component